MFSWLFKWRQRRSLKPLVSTLPVLLTKAYGAADHYTPQQVRRTLEKIQARPELWPYAFSAFCRAADVPPHFNLPEAERLACRSELVELFDIGRRDFSVEDIRRLKKSSRWTPAEWWHSDWSHYRDHGDGPGHSPF